MKKIVILLITFLTASIMPCQGQTPLPSPSTPSPSTQSSAPTHPSLHTLSSISFYSLSGKSTIHRYTRVIEELPANDFQTKPLRWTIVSKDKAIGYGNVGTSEEAVYRQPQSISIVETTPTGSKHVLTISNEWLSKYRGFRATYDRTLISLGGEVVHSIYLGYIRPE